MKRVAAAAGLAWALGCSGVWEPPVPETPPLPAPRAAPAPPTGGAGDCSVGMVGALVGVPGYGGPAPEELLLRKHPELAARPWGRFTAEGLGPAGKPSRWCAGPLGAAGCLSVAVADGQRGLPVYEVDGPEGWALVGTGGGGDFLADGRCRRRGWVPVGGPVRVRSATEVLVAASGASLRAGAGGPLHDGPGGAVAAEVDGPRPVRVLGGQVHDGRPWVEVEVLGGTPCAPTSPERRGWLPLHDAAGRVRVWVDAC